MGRNQLVRPCTVHLTTSSMSPELSHLLLGFISFGCPAFFATFQELGDLIRGRRNFLLHALNNSVEPFIVERQSKGVKRPYRFWGPSCESPYWISR